MVGTNPELKPQKSFYFKLLKIKDLPSAAVILRQVAKMVDNDSTNTVKLADVITRDQGLTTKILAAANSPMYELSRRVSTVEYAIMVLGFDQIRQLTMALSMVDSLDTVDNENWKKLDYWNHCLLTGNIAKKIADEIDYLNPGEAFTAGLLHDLGIVILQKFFNDDYNKVFEKIKKQDVNILETEDQITGFTHADIGLFLLNKWDMPFEICDSVLNHHEPASSKKYPVLSSIAHLADVLANRVAPLPFIWDKNISLDTKVFEVLNIQEEFCEVIMEDFKGFKGLQLI
jgi:putative nucleotidyltransferase with HDIG domain